MPCSWHHDSDEGLVTVWPPAFRQWASDHHLTTDTSHPAVADSVSMVHRVGRDSTHRDEPRLSITSPPAGAVYLIDPTLRREFQTLPLRAIANRTSRSIDWAVDGTPVGTSRPDGSVEWPLAPGEHRVTAEDRAGRVAEARILVK